MQIIFWKCRFFLENVDYFLEKQKHKVINITPVGEVLLKNTMYIYIDATSHYNCCFESNQH